MDPSPASQDEEAEFWLFGYGYSSTRLYPRLHPTFLAGIAPLSSPSPSYPSPPISSHLSSTPPGKVRPALQFPRLLTALPPSHPHSEDHRGTPESPGRVVTLIEHAHWRDFLRERDEDRDRDYYHDVPSSSHPLPIVWGAAYRIPRPLVETVKTYLDIREINGYSIQHADFYPCPSPSPSLAASQQPVIKNTLLYIGLPTNPNFLGPLHPREVSAVIAGSKGPSGENAEYLFMLEHALESLGPGSGDKHVRGLAARVRALLLDKGEKLSSRKGADGGDKDYGLEGMIRERGEDEETTGDEQAETEKP